MCWNGIGATHTVHYSTLLTMQNQAITLYYFMSAVPGIGLWVGSRRLEVGA